MTWKLMKRFQQKPVENKEEELPTSVFLCTKLFFQPNDVGNETWSLYSDEEKTKLMEACEGRILISGSHKTQAYYELSSGIVFVITDTSSYRTGCTIKQMDEAILQENNIVFVKT